MTRRLTCPTFAPPPPGRPGLEMGTNGEGRRQFGARQPGWTWALGRDSGRVSSAAERGGPAPADDGRLRHSIRGSRGAAKASVDEQPRECTGAGERIHGSETRRDATRRDGAEQLGPAGVKVAVRTRWHSTKNERGRGRARRGLRRSEGGGRRERGKSERDEGGGGGDGRLALRRRGPVGGIKGQLP